MAARINIGVLGTDPQAPSSVVAQKTYDLANKPVNIRMQPMSDAAGQNVK